MSRPIAAPGLVDGLRAQVAPRIAKRLDAGNPAEGWTWTATGDGWTVKTDGDDVVSVTGPGPVEAAHLRCTCLLAPKCLHLLAVAAALPATGAAAPVVEVAPPAPPEPEILLDAGQRAAAQATRKAAVAVLLAGASGVGATARDDLLRAVHGCREAGLHRLARAGQRVLRHVRNLQRARPEFSLEDLVEDLQELLLVAHALAADRVVPGWIGTARRAYDPVGTLRLYGLCTEPVIATGGQAGVATWLCDAQGRLWTVSDVRPGGPGRARATYPAAAAIGGATLPHQELGRNGLFVQDATASADGRLGTGQGVKAVRAGPSAWSEAVVAALFATPLSAQLERGGLVFLRARVLGVERDALLVAAEGLAMPVRLVPPSDHAELHYRDNLRLLGRAPGLPVEVIGRVQPGARAIGPIAIGAWALEGVDLPGLQLPPEWAGRCNLGLDRLVSAHVERLGREVVELASDEDRPGDALEPLRRRVARLALGGRGTLPGDARGAVERERAGLVAALMPHAARVLGQLADAAAARAAGDALATSWLAAAVYTGAATRSLRRADWR